MQYNITHLKFCCRVLFCWSHLFLAILWSEEKYSELTCFDSSGHNHSHSPLSSARDEFIWYCTGNHGASTVHSHLVMLARRSVLCPPRHSHFASFVNLRYKICIQQRRGRLLRTRSIHIGVTTGVLPALVVLFYLICSAMLDFGAGWKTKRID